MKKILLASILPLLLLTGCAATSVTPQGQQVVIVQSMPQEYAGRCQFVGEVAGSQGNWITGNWTPNKNLALGARNDLRNEAAKLGANVVLITDSFNSTDDDNSLENITNIGRAYRCR